MSRGEVVFLEGDPMKLRSILASFDIDGLFGRFDAVGENSDARRSETRWPALIHSSILATSFIGTLVSAALTGRTYGYLREHRRRIERMFGKRLTHEVVPLSVATLPH